MPVLSSSSCSSFCPIHCCCLASPLLVRMRIAATDPMSRGSSTHNCNNRRGNEEIIRMGKEMRKGSLARRMAATDERIWPRCSLFSTRQTDANSSASNVRGVTPLLEVRVSRLLISDWRNENEARRPLGNVMFSVTLWRRWRWRGRPLQHSLRGKLPVT